MHHAIVLLHITKDVAGDVVDAHLLDFGERDVDFAVVAHLLDESSMMFANVNGLIELVVIDHSPVLAINNDSVTYLLLLHDEHVNLLAVVEIGSRVVQELVELGACHDALAGGVEIGIDDVAAQNCPTVAKGCSVVATGRFSES